MEAAAGLIAVAAVAILTLGIGAYGLRFSRTTSDFYVASRVVTPIQNASAIGGEYLSAASFLGAAGLIFAHGADMLWYPVGWTAGYLVLLVLVAGPLRRSGAYTLPDFAEARLESRTVRLVASVLVVGIGWLYLMPQFRGAGLTLQNATGAPAWVGGLIVGAVVLANALSGGMRSITLVQAFQYWLKLTAIALPVLFLFFAWRADGAVTPADYDRPVFRDATTVRVDSDVQFTVTAPLTVRVDGMINDVRRDGGAVRLTEGVHEVRAGSTVRFSAGSAVPVTTDLPPLENDSWKLPLGGGQDHPLYATYSLILATFLGTMGLPHVLVRFYTNPDGRAARRTALAVLCLLGAFYVFPAAYGALGRIYTPELLFTGKTDAVILDLPHVLVPGFGGQLLGMLVTAGAFAAFLSTSSGLAISVTGVLSQDLIRHRVGGVAGFRFAAVAAVAIPVMLAVAAERLSVAGVVGLAFAVAASTFCPLLVLGIWWHRLTDAGAVAGLLVGGGLAGSAVIATLITDWSGWTGALLEQPAAWTVPLAFAVMVVVSLVTARRIPPDVARTMVRLHAPEQLDVDRSHRPPPDPGPAFPAPGGVPGGPPAPAGPGVPVPGVPAPPGVSAPPGVPAPEVPRPGPGHPGRPHPQSRPGAGPQAGSAYAPYPGHPHPGPGPGRSGPAHPGPAHPGPAHPGPAQHGTAYPDPGRPGPALPNPHPGPAGPARPDPARPDPPRPGWGQAGPGGQDPAQRSRYPSPAQPPGSAPGSRPPGLQPPAPNRPEPGSGPYEGSGHPRPAPPLPPHEQPDRRHNVRQPDPRQSDRRRPDPWQPDPWQPTLPDHPRRPEQPHLAQPHLAQPHPAQPHPAQPHPAQPHPAQTHPGQPHQEQTYPERAPYRLAGPPRPQPGWERLEPSQDPALRDGPEDPYLDDEDDWPPPPNRHL